MRRSFAVVCTIVIQCLVATSAINADVDDDLASIAAVRAGAQGSTAARAARDRLASMPVDGLPKLLEAMDTPNVVALNWYRTVFQQIVDRERQRESPQWPIEFLQRYARNPERQGRVRRLVLRLLDDIRPGFRSELLPTLLNDPEFREDAVNAVLQTGNNLKKKGDDDGAKQAFLTAFRHARNSGQISDAASRLKSVGEQVDIIRHMGFVTDWYVLGPFHAPETTGFELEFPPQESPGEVDLTATYVGKDDATIAWKRHDSSGDRFGQMNLIRAIAPVKEAVGYAIAELNSPRAQDVQLRCGADDNLSVWLNARPVLARKQWLNGTRLDRFTAPVRLKKGTNRLLVKICQGPQHKNPAVPNNWSLQLRLCDAEGGSVGVTSAFPAAKEVQE